MTSYEYDYITESNLVVPQGTQQAPALIALLNGRGRDGWKVISFVGDIEDSFVVLLMREVENG